MSSTHEPSPATAAPDALEMPAPQVRELPARSIKGGLALLLGLLGLLVAAGLVASGASVTAAGAKAALTVVGILTGIAALLAMSAVVAARREIVNGAVGMVEAALARIAEQDIVELDEERKAAMVSNLMVVLCGDRAPQPVLNAGTLYQ
ncbi:hypothetical protein AB0L59_05790 [Streptomyces sp. NPDC052109]|uniref:hypothetical protein n=1 Tax=Streptomyces sp. NPDC052109 TaxID=3155527 RepID=UPI00342FB814